MAPKVFITGVTGYIGGDILYALNKAHPDWEYSALIRSEEKAKPVQAKYPNVKPVIGGLDDSNIIKEAAAKADIVIHTADASDHEGAACAIAAGIAEGHSASNKPGFWLHTSGTGILTFADQRSGRLGEPDDKVFNDWTAVEELTNLPDDAFHRDIDKIVLEASSPSVRTAVICPPTIYGEGRGPVSGRSRQAYALAKMILTQGTTPIIGGGKAVWNQVHVHDLSDAYVLLAEAAAAGNLSDELWNARGYFLAENGEFVWGDYSRQMAKKAHELGFLKEAPKEQALSKDEALEFGGFEAVSWGLNSRGKAERLTKTLGWKPHRPSIEDEIPTILKSEKALLEKK